MKTLRYYQKEAVDSIFRYFERESGNPLVAIPTAGGKSLVIASFLQQVLAQYPNQKILVVTHVRELIAQNYAELKSNWPEAPCGIYSAGLKKRDTKFPIIFAGIASVSRKHDLFGKVDLVLVDEAHLVGTAESAQYLRFLAALKETNPKVKVIGFTATPYRLGVGSLTEGGIFTHLCYDITRGEDFTRLVDEGYLCPLVTKKTFMEYDLRGVRTSAGEFNQHDVQIAVDREDLTIPAVKEIMYYGQTRNRWLIFASGIQHANHVTSVLNAWGIPTKCIYSDGMKNEERDAILESHRRGEIKAVVNCKILTTGYNDPQIDLLAILLPTKSAVLWVQMLGRGMRIYPDKTDCLVLDFAGNTKRLGPVNDPVLPLPKGQRRGGGGGVPIKVCSKCYTYCPAGCATCPQCGYEFPQLVHIESEASSEEVMVRKKVAREWWVPVDRVVFSEYHKPGSPVSILVSYHCGLQLHREWMCLAHPRGNLAVKKARDLWRTLSDGKPPPDTIEEAMCRLGELRAPNQIKVFQEGTYYTEVIGYDFKGLGES